MAIPKHFLEDLIERTDLVDFFESQGVHLKKSGTSYMARCPFHNEKTPSFSVVPAKHFYHCFGCGQSGDAIRFLREKNGYTFLEAVKYLADRLGLEIPDERKFSPMERQRYQAAKDKKTRILLTLKKAATFYYQNLKNADIAKNYCKNRGLTGLTAQHFGIGFSPDSWNGLAQIFPDYERNQDLIDAGLVKINERGGRFDFFRARLMIPILNAQGEVIGFGARVLRKEDEKKGGKYINSPETAVFEKGKELFGLCQAQKALAAENCAIVCEGYLDVMMLNQHGILNTLAALGTAITSFHIRKLLRYVDKIIFSFDGDAAGRKAAWRALDNALPELRDSKRIFFVFLPEGEDPDSFVRQHGKEAFEDFLKNAEALSSFLLRHFEEEYGLDSPESRAQFLSAIKGYLAKIAAPLLKSQLIKSVAERTFFKEEEVQSAVDAASASLAAREEPPQFSMDNFSPFDSFDAAPADFESSDVVRQRKNDNLSNYWHGLLKSILMNPQNIEEAKTSALPQWMDENPNESSMDFLLLSLLLKLTRTTWEMPLELDEVERFVQSANNAALYQHFIAVKRAALELKASRPFADLLANLQAAIDKNKKRKNPR